MRILACALLAIGSVGLLGCGGGDSPAKGKSDIGDDKQQLATLLTEFADTGSAAGMNAYFSGTKVTPAEYKKYLAYAYDFDGKPEVSGTTASGKVKIKTNDGKDVGTRDWAFVKEGDKWKLKTAPLP